MNMKPKPVVSVSANEAQERHDLIVERVRTLLLSSGHGLITLDADTDLVIHDRNVFADTYGSVTLRQVVYATLASLELSYANARTDVVDGIEYVNADDAVALGRQAAVKYKELLDRLADE